MWAALVTISSPLLKSKLIFSIFEIMWFHCVVILMMTFNFVIITNVINTFIEKFFRWLVVAASCRTIALKTLLLLSTIVVVRSMILLLLALFFDVCCVWTSLFTSFSFEFSLAKSRSLLSAFTTTALRFDNFSSKTIIQEHFLASSASKSRIRKSFSAIFWLNSACAA